LGGVAVVLTCFAMAIGGSPSEAFVDGRPLLAPNMVYLVLIGGLVVVGASAVGATPPGPSVLPGVAATLFAPIYLGLPLGALAAVRVDLSSMAHLRELPTQLPDGRVVLLLLMIVIV